MPVSTTYLPSTHPLVDLTAGIVTYDWLSFFQSLSTLAVTVNSIPGQHLFALAAQPALGAADAGYVAYITDYGHFCRWTGTVWQFAPGDVGNGFFRDFALTPQEVGWKLCDGTATDYLTVGGATLTATAITPPDLTSTASYRKSAAAYTGTLVAASGSTATGTTGTGTTGTGTTGNDSASTLTYNAGAYVLSTPAEPHTHTIPGLSVPGLTVPALGVGSLDMAHLNVLCYFRR